jgi:hypothetical protein
MEIGAAVVVAVVLAYQLAIMNSTLKRALTELREIKETLKKNN